MTRTIALSAAQQRAMDAARALTDHGLPEFTRLDLQRVTLRGPGVTSGHRSAFAHTVRALVRGGHLNARVDDQTLADLADHGWVPDLIGRLRSGDRETLCEYGFLLLLSLPDADRKQPAHV